MSEDTDPIERPQYATPSRDYLRERLQQMDPAAFERFVADVWTYLGWDTRVVGEPGDRGIDVVATTKDGDKQLIQAKRYGPDTTVGSPEVQQYASLRLQEDGVNQVTIVTTGTFSQQAEELAPELDVILVDGEALLGVLEEVDAFEVFARHFEDISVQAAGSADRHGQEQAGGLLDRFRGWLR
jgi:restriction system protein